MICQMEEGMSPTAAELVRADRKHLIHQLHHPVDNGDTVIYVRGRSPGDILFFAPPLVVTEADIDRLVSAARDSVEVVLGAPC
jgi:adenosylmethionine-8-amino-7-oxononanoate aminotransferase